MFSVRRIRPDEAAVLRSVRLEALADAPGDATTTLARTQALADDHWIASAAANASGGLQATFFAEAAPGEADDRLVESGADLVVVGMVGAYANRDGVVNVVGLWSAPGYRDIGVATALLDATGRWARDSGAGRLRLWVVERNEFARRFYESEGFVATGAAMPYELEPKIRQVEMLLAL